MTTTFILKGVPDYNDDEDTCEGALTLWLSLDML